MVLLENWAAPKTCVYFCRNSYFGNLVSNFQRSFILKRIY